MFQNLRQTVNSKLLQDGVLMGIIVLVGTVSLLENVVAPVIRKMYNNYNGAETDSISLEDYLGN